MEIWDLWDTLNQIWDRIWDLWEKWEIYAQWAASNNHNPRRLDVFYVVHNILAKYNLSDLANDSHVFLHGNQLFSADDNCNLIMATINFVKESGWLM